MKRRKELKESIELLEEECVNGLLNMTAAYKIGKAVVVSEPCQEFWEKHRDTCHISVVEMDIAREELSWDYIKIFLPKNNYYFSPFLKYQLPEGAESVHITLYIYQQK